ncbi:MAG: SGNH/GDSL hydrolase family protein, partial [Verrucomicrobiaceae bacterium]
MIFKSFSLLLLSSMLMMLPAHAQFAFQKGDKVCIIGNSLSDRMQFDSWMETLIHRGAPELELIFRNISACGDEVAKRPRSENVPNGEALLAECKADVIFCFFGYNESFQGQAGIEKFKNDYSAMIDSYKAKNFNGKNTLRFVLFSPIACENLKTKLVPDGSANNNRIALYVNAIKEVAEAKKETFVDLFQPTLDIYGKAKTPLTINGVHLSSEGNRQLGMVIAEALLKKKMQTLATDEKLREAVNAKNVYWHNAYRPADSNDIFGNRSGLSFEKGQSNGQVLRHEITMWKQMTANRDPQI